MTWPLVSSSWRWQVFLRGNVFLFFLENEVQFKLNLKRPPRKTFFLVPLGLDNYNSTTHFRKLDAQSVEKKHIYETLCIAE